METLINPLSDPTLWQGDARATDWDNLMVERRPSTILRLQQSNTAVLEFTDPIDISQYDMLSMNVALLRRGMSGGNLVFTLNDTDEYRFPNIQQTMNRITFLLDEDQTELTKISIYQEGGLQEIVVANLIGLKSELPADILEMFKRNLEQEILNKNYQLPVAQVSCKQGDTNVILEGDCDFLERFEVLILGDRRYQIGNKVDHKVSFLTTYDGDTIVEDFIGTAYVVLPVEIGFYDREIALPSVSLWYNSPTPTQRSTYGLIKTTSFVNGNIVTEKQGAYMRWRITMEIAARSPQLVQLMARCVRAYLLKGGGWCNGVKLNWFWKDPAQDTESVADYDIVPRAQYGVEVEICEEVYESCQRTGTKKLNLRVFPHSRQ